MQAQAMMGQGAPGGPPPQGGAGHGDVGLRPLPPSSVPPHFLPPRNQHPGLVGGGHMGDLGPPNNPQGQGLSRFFSPEVLAQAQSGNAPPLPPLPTQKAMTLEEIERQAATVRI